MSNVPEGYKQISIKRLNKMCREYDQMKAREGQLLKQLSKQEDQLKLLRVTITRYEADLKSGNRYRGRNKTNKIKFDGHDHTNNMVVGPLLRLYVFRHHKFWHPSWKKCLPDDPNSFFCKIIGEFDIPAGVSVVVYWNNHLVPIINKKVIEIRSNFTNYCKKEYLSKWPLTCVVRSRIIVARSTHQTDLPLLPLALHIQSASQVMDTTRTSSTPSPTRMNSLKKAKTSTPSSHSWLRIFPDSTAAGARSRSGFVSTRGSHS